MTGQSEFEIARECNWGTYGRTRDGKVSILERNVHVTGTPTHPFVSSGFNARLSVGGRLLPEAKLLEFGKQS